MSTTLSRSGLSRYVGLMGALASEIAVRVPGVGVARGAIGGTIVVMAVGAFAIHRRLPRVIEEMDRG